MSEFNFLLQEEQSRGNSRIKTKKKVKGYHRIEFHLDDDLKQVFVGHHTLFSVLGFTVGGILIGGTLQELLNQHLGDAVTLLIGLILLLVSGLILKLFNG
jgi:uncharacterized membrane protein YraQ (UPF0718 family)